jgi:hypothetical protein
MRRMRRRQILQEGNEIGVLFAAGRRLPIGGDFVGALLLRFESDARAHIQQISHGGAVIGRGRDLRHIGRYVGVQIEVAGFVQHSGQQADDGLGGRHQNVRRMRVVAPGIPFEPKLAVAQNHDRVGTHGVEEEFRKQRAAALICFDHFGNIRRIIFNRRGRDNLVDLAKCPAAVKRGTPVREIGFGGAWRAFCHIGVDLFGRKRG